VLIWIVGAGVVVVWTELVVLLDTMKMRVYSFNWNWNAYTQLHTQAQLYTLLKLILALVTG